MNQPKANSKYLQEKIRQMYDFLPYPESDIEYLPKDNLETLFVHSLVTPYYLRYQQGINTRGAIILDAGCGSGVKSLVLAMANPGAKIVGVDISPKSVELARQRFAYHGFENAEFHILSLDQIESLGYQFDYINCDEVLYLLPEPREVLKIFRNILKPRGIIRSNLHSYYQRNAFFRSQKAFKIMGLFDESSTEVSIEVVLNTLEALQDFVKVKQLFKGFESQQKPNLKQIKQWILANYLIQGDKGYTVEELFDFLSFAELDFISMVNWRQWELTSLFKEPENLPPFWQLGLAEASELEKLQLVELFNPVNRLLDFWAGQKDNSSLPISPVDWSEEQWLSCRVCLHPVLANNKVKEDLYQAIAKRESFQISQYIPLPASVPIKIDSLLSACLLPLWESDQSLSVLVERWLILQPRVPETLELKTLESAREEVQELLTKLETFTYVLLELT
jgi:2-polyprenyl-3-methyl-5-hydroxy-6-metoxy-1,4-benzoquinol methylase